MTRLVLKQFAGKANNNGVFGSLKAGSPKIADDLNEIQSLPAYEQGWQEASSNGNLLPPLEELQGVEALLSAGIKQINSYGILPWDSNETYFKNAITFDPSNEDYILYRNLTGKNTAVSPSKDTENWEAIKFGGGSSVPLGSLIQNVGQIDDANFALLDGREISKKGMYKAFCDLVQKNVEAGKWFACTEEEYQEDIEKFGQAGRFVIKENAIKIPTITKFLGATITLEEIGKGFEESLPNFNGHIGVIGDTRINIRFLLDVVGHMQIEEAGTYTGYGQGPGGGTGKLARVNLSNASKAYKDGAKVQTDHIKYPYYMCISNVGQVDKVVIDINQVNEDLQLKADANAKNFTQEGKNEIISFFMPDYSSGIDVSAEFTQGTDWMANKTGLYVFAVSSPNGYIDVQIPLDIINSPFVNISYSTAGDARSSRYISKGDIFKVVQFTQPCQVYYYPLKGGDNV